MYSYPWLVKDMPLSSCPGSHCASRRHITGTVLNGRNVPATPPPPAPPPPPSGLRNPAALFRSTTAPPTTPALPCTHLRQNSLFKGGKKGMKEPVLSLRCRATKLSEGSTEFKGYAHMAATPQDGTSRPSDKALQAIFLEVGEQGGRNATADILMTAEGGDTDTLPCSALVCVAESRLSPLSLLLVGDSEVFLLLLSSESERRHLVSALSHTAIRTTRLWSTDSLSLGRFTDILCLATAAKRRTALSPLLTGPNAAVIPTDSIHWNAVLAKPPLDSILYSLRSLGDFHISYSVLFSAGRRWAVVSDTAISSGWTPEAEEGGGPPPKSRGGGGGGFARSQGYDLAAPHSKYIVTRVPFATFADDTAYVAEVVPQGRQGEATPGGGGGKKPAPKKPDGAQPHPFYVVAVAVSPRLGGAAVSGAPHLSGRSTAVCVALHLERRAQKFFSQPDDTPEPTEALNPILQPGGGVDDSGIALFGPFASGRDCHAFVGSLKTAFAMSQCRPLLIRPLLFRQAEVHRASNAVRDAELQALCYFREAVPEGGGAGGEFYSDAEVPLQGFAEGHYADRLQEGLAVPPCDHSASVTVTKDSLSLQWCRYMLLNNLDRLLTALSSLEAPGGSNGFFGIPIVARALVKACCTEGRIPALLAESLALEIRQQRGLDTLMLSAENLPNAARPSLPSLIVSMYAGTALDEWALGVITLVLRQISSNRVGIFSESDHAALKEYTIYIVRGISLSDRDKTVPPEVRLVAGAIQYATSAVAQPEGKGFLELFGSFLVDRGFGRCLDNPSRTPVGGDFSLLSRVLRAVLTQRGFAENAPGGLHALNAWVMEQRKPVSFVYTSIANPHTMPANSVARPGVPRGARKTEVARLTSGLGQRYTVPPLLLGGLGPLVSCVQQNSFELLLNAWCMEDIMASDMEKKNEIIRSNRHHEL